MALFCYFFIFIYSFCFFLLCCVCEVGFRENCLGALPRKMQFRYFFLFKFFLFSRHLTIIDYSPPFFFLSSVVKMMIIIIIKKNLVFSCLAPNAKKQTSWKMYQVLDLYHTYFVFLLFTRVTVLFPFRSAGYYSGEKRRKERERVINVIYRPVWLTCAHIHPIQRLLAYCIVCVNMFYTVASSIITRIYPECGTIFFPSRKNKKRNILYV